MARKMKKRPVPRLRKDRGPKLQPKPKPTRLKRGDKMPRPLALAGKSGRRTSSASQRMDNNKKPAGRRQMTRRKAGSG